MTSTERQKRLLEEFEQARTAIREFITSRSERERTVLSTAIPDQWSAGELLTAIGFWMDYMVERMEYFRRGETPPAHVDFGAVQAGALTEQAHWAWEQRVLAFERANAALIDEVCLFDDEHLAAHNAYGDDPGDELSGEVEANGCIWPLQELDKYYKQTGEPDRAARVRALLVSVTGEPDRVVCDLTSPETLATMSAEAAPVIIDVRGKADYARGHLPGALHIPLAELPRKLKRLPTDRSIITYCNMHHPGQSRGERAAALLAEHGLHASALAGGFTAWEASQRPVETSN
ncbi:MAG: rhodanese-like domain-containing protein [Ktedonobacterales bacterium]